MSAVEAPKPVDVPEAGHVEPAPAPVVESGNASAPVDEPKTEEVAKTEDDTVAPPTESKEEKAEEKVVEPIYSGSLGYKAPGLKNAFRFSKKFFWFGEDPVDSANLREYLRGEKPEVAHPVVAWASQTGKGLLFFVKHADQKEHPAGVINLAYATDLAKDGLIAFSVKISGHKHTFEAQNAAERDGWFVAIERAITEAKACKDSIESSDGYKEQKEKISKPTALAGATTAPKKSMDAAPKLAEGEAAGTSSETPAAAPARTGSSSSSSSDEQKKAKKSKSKSRSASRKRASIFGFGKKDKTPKEDGAAVKTDGEAKTEESSAIPHLNEVGETPSAGPVTTNAPVITSEIPQAGQEMKDEATPAAATTEADAPQEKPAVKKRGSIFGTFVEKLKSPTTEKKEHELVAPPPPAKDSEATPEAAKTLDEAVAGAPATPVADASESAAPKTEEKPGSTPSKEKEHFSFGKLFGSKERSKSPAAADKAAEPKSDVAPQVQDAAAANESAAPLQPVEPTASATEAKVEPAHEETPKKEKRTSFFGNLSRSLSKATSGKKEAKPAEKKESSAAIPEGEENKAETPAAAHVQEASTAASAEKSIGDVPAEAVTVGEAPKSTQTVPATA
ncbi:hypothetical protein LEMA_P052590.1 [Plenodomus lingam JN3]|uniref:Meiotic expression up-regulated protein 6 PH domain-containing protein n=1 Tax=Leptosphaeria maculans (strain JN3 / isolate v23.1.3 / race Av1-4-5-6-7-8) TaxID=985895 RepID=E4ZMV0_LEPMJ|nr:hypothetical protein LEMA_P052590.1 [Plenodomus lingam JN3]CBX92553.1 hypothetical protein LEMA_P052590.1 [Plenodomus lingam JN3]